MENNPRKAAGRPRSEEAREAILLAALAILVREGYENLSIEGVAREAGTGKSTIYRWWGGRGDRHRSVANGYRERDVGGSIRGPAHYCWATWISMLRCLTCGWTGMPGEISVRRIQRLSGRSQVRRRRWWKPDVR